MFVPVVFPNPLFCCIFYVRSLARYSCSSRTLMLSHQPLSFFPHLLHDFLRPQDLHPLAQLVRYPNFSFRIFTHEFR